MFPDWLPDGDSSVVKLLSVGLVGGAKEEVVRI